jgi:uncharacterized protein YbaR (Trm112 family)
MDITIWGPGLWELIHTVTYNYSTTTMTETKKKQYINFFTKLGDILPCPHCKEHYVSYLNKYPIQNNINSYDSITKWVNNLHNIVNSKLKKKVYTLNESKAKYFSNNVLLINHHIIYNFLDNTITTINSNNIESFKTFFNSLFHIFPCEPCRLKLNIINRTNKLHLINENGAKKWYSNINIKSLHT